MHLNTVDVVSFQKTILYYKLLCELLFKASWATQGVKQPYVRAGSTLKMQLTGKCFHSPVALPAFQMLEIQACKIH